MGTKFKLGVKGELYLQAFASLETAMRKIAGFHLLTFQNSISRNMFVSDCLPYEAAKNYKKMMVDFECRHQRVLVDAQRAMRGV